MRRWLPIVAFLVALPFLASGNSAPGVQVQDEGSLQGAAWRLNCTGAGIACTVSGGTATLNATGGGSSPLTTKGDLFGRDASADARVPVGADGLCLKADSADAEGVVWASCGGGAGNFVEASIGFGDGKGLVYTVSVAATWVSGTSVIVCSPFATTADGLTLEQTYAAGINVAVSNRSAGVGFDLSAYSPHGASGIHRFHCTGG